MILPRNRLFFSLQYVVMGYWGGSGNKKSPHFEQSVAIKLFGGTITQSAIVVGNVGTYFVLFARCDRYSRSEEDSCKQEEFQVLVHDIVCFRGEYSDLLMLFCRCHDNDSSVYLVIEEAL